ncbi:alanine dehydrogenase [Solitalea koreensis]|uniref:alanine dehydrogenase n=1 Tax=Solitalea koreensis TaxID=543615 RepID=A0A521B0D2_9SPHI|nr:alanine dehydrogenase [Solitalea koreensis]SMO40564.1 alanine dehydrogenase [Solitalea koreensis]
MSPSIMSGFSEVAKQALLQPQESLLEIKKKKQELAIGIPKELAFQEKRIAITPSSVEVLVSNGHDVYVEAGAGEGAHFSDKKYSDAGAKIIYHRKEIFNADILMKVAPPTMEEIGMMKMGQTLISAINIAVLREDYIKALMNKKVTALGYEYLKDEDGSLVVVRSMSEIVGNTAIQVAAEYLSNSRQGKGMMFGGVTGIPSTEVVIIGAGTVGEFAARAALALGCEVKIFDDSLYRLRRLQSNLSKRIFTSVIQPKVLVKALRTCDVAIGALRANDGRCPCIVSEEMVTEMQPDSVIIDVSIDQGGCFETSQMTNHENPIYRKHDVIHYCVPNIPSRVARTASYALTNIFTPILTDIGDNGGIKNMMWIRKGVRQGVYIYQGHLTNVHLSEQFKLPYKDLDLLVAAQR